MARTYIIWCVPSRVARTIKLRSIPSFSQKHYMVYPVVRHRYQTPIHTPRALTSPCLLWGRGTPHAPWASPCPSPGRLPTPLTKRAPNVPCVSVAHVPLLVNWWSQGRVPLVRPCGCQNWTFQVWHVLYYDSVDNVCMPFKYPSHPRHASNASIWPWADVYNFFNVGCKPPLLVYKTERVAPI